jgi:hypothetical protein
MRDTVKIMIMIMKRLKDLKEGKMLRMTTRFKRLKRELR